jgi:putative hydrolase of the HAD superfamily
MQNIKNIIFDYGNVIFMIDFLKTQQSFTDLGVENVEKFFAHSGHNSIFSEFEKGNITASEFRNGIRDIVQKPHLKDEEIDAAWTSLLIGVPPINHEILIKAKAKYRTFLLSNINEIHLDFISKYLQNTFNIQSNDVFFEKVYYSHIVRLRKPDRNIFEHVLSDSKLDVNETLFIDDSPQHLKTAQEMGFQTHLMTSEDSLQRFFERTGLVA